MSAEKRSISAPAELFAQADERKRALGYPTFSDYIQALIRADTITAAAHYREASTPYNVSSDQKAANDQNALKVIAAGSKKPKRKKNTASDAK